MFWRMCNQLVDWFCWHYKKHNFVSNKVWLINWFLVVTNTLRWENGFRSDTLSTIFTLQSCAMPCSIAPKISLETEWRLYFVSWIWNRYLCCDLIQHFSFHKVWHETRLFISGEIFFTKSEAKIQTKAFEKFIKLIREISISC